MKRTLEEKIRKAQNIIDFSKLNIEMSNYLYHPKNSAHRRVIQENIFLQNVGQSCKRVGIIELCKLIGKDEVSFSVIFNQIKENYRVLEASLKNWENILEEHGESILEIKKLRNKIYSHCEISHKKTYNYNFDKYLKLILVLEKILLEIIEELEFTNHKEYNNESLKEYNGHDLIEKLLQNK